MGTSSYELFQLRCFVAVAEELNFRRAAGRLNMTQPPLSRQIKLLEHAVGEVLLFRTSREVRLTSAGASFLVSANSLLQQAELAVLVARQAARGEAGDVALGFVPSAGINFVPRIACAVMEHLPDVNFKPIEMMSYEIIQSLRSGQLDMGLTRTSRRHAEIESLQVVSEPFVLAVPSDHPLARSPAPEIADLDGLRFVGYSADRGGYLCEQHKVLFIGLGITPRIVMEVSQTMTILSCVNSGIGVSLVPRSSLAVQMSNLTFREIETPDRLRSTLYLTIGPRRRDTPLSNRMRDIIADVLRDAR
ncbi:Hca operon transcriptional activator HcaR [Antarctobacter heliothermus]|uniref:Hca operon transcriptional activator HcaR n=1 Tax=Antarctobacter heliothermus TaxID=74033 RepID=A0A222EA51_9RHOB|nr:LysR substrate-binding domain-containing protein [Antarctobacter heliothermus]ASP23077.1 Hca operon transcriptional activator HcaR [Antarctobacter heliothermus]